MKLPKMLGKPAVIVSFALIMCLSPMSAFGAQEGGDAADGILAAGRAQSVESAAVTSFDDLKRALDQAKFAKDIASILTDDADLVDMKAKLKEAIANDEAAQKALADAKAALESNDVIAELANRAAQAASAMTDAQSAYDAVLDKELRAAVLKYMGVATELIDDADFSSVNAYIEKAVKAAREFSDALESQDKVVDDEALKQQLVEQALEALKAVQAALEEAKAAYEDSVVSIAGAKVQLNKSKFTYDGRAKKPAVVSVELSDGTAVPSGSYTVSYSSNVKAGVGKVTVEGTQGFKDTAVKKFSIAKAKNTMKVATKTKRVAQKKLKKKAVVVKKAITAKKAKGKLTFKNVSKAKAAKKFKVNKSTGAIAVPKGTKKRTYKIKVRVKAAETANYLPASKTVTVKLVVK